LSRSRVSLDEQRCRTIRSLDVALQHVDATRCRTRGTGNAVSWFKAVSLMITVRPQKITFADMRTQGVRGLLIYCADYKCSHSIAISGDRELAHSVLIDNGRPGFALGER
jgi:hypothetical protein